MNNIEQEAKACLTCGEVQSLNNFYYNKRDNCYRRDCKVCVNKLTTKRRRDNPDAYRNQKLKQTFGITIEDYNTMAEHQDRCCAICGKHESDCVRGKLYVDHCHSTQEVRSLLCHNCNLGLGHFKDDIESLRSAVKYLEASRGD